MEKRMYYGVDLNVNYADLIKAELDPDVRQELLLKRQFKLGCFIRERGYHEGMIVVDCNLKGWWVKEIEGECIEDMTFLVQDMDGKEETCVPVDVVDFKEVSLESELQAMQFALCAAVGIREEMPILKRPSWFHVVDQILEMERRDK